MASSFAGSFNPFWSTAHQGIELSPWDPRISAHFCWTMADKLISLRSNFSGGCCWTFEPEITEYLPSATSLELGKGLASGFGFSLFEQIRIQAVVGSLMQNYHLSSHFDWDYFTDSRCRNIWFGAEKRDTTVDQVSRTSGRGEEVQYKPVPWHFTHLRLTLHTHTHTAGCPSAAWTQGGLLGSGLHWLLEDFVTVALTVLGELLFHLQTLPLLGNFRQILGFFSRILYFP